MIDRDSYFALSGDRLEKLKAISRRLNHPAALTFDQRRDDANLIDLIVSEAIGQKIDC